MSDKCPDDFQIHDHDLNQILTLIETSHCHIRKVIDLNTELLSFVVNLMAEKSWRPNEDEGDTWSRSEKNRTDFLF